MKKGMSYESLHKPESDDNPNNDRKDNDGEDQEVQKNEAEEKKEELELKSGFMGNNDILVTRPENDSSDKEEDAFFPEAVSIISNIMRRIGRIEEKKPRIVKLVQENSNEKFEGVSGQIIGEYTENDYLVDLIEKSHISTDIFLSFQSVEDKIIKELSNGHFRAKRTNSLSLDRWIKRYEFLSKRHEEEKLLLSKDQLKELEIAQQQKAVKFSNKMKVNAANFKRKFQEENLKVQEKISLEEREEIINHRRRQENALEIQRAKAEAALVEIKMRKKHRQIVNQIGNIRERKVLEKIPFHVQKDEEYKRHEDMMYYSRGRTRKSIENFKREKSMFHYMRNKKEFDGFILDPSSLTKMRISQSPQTKLPSASNFRYNNIRSSYNNNNTEGIYVIDGISFDRPLKFGVLPRIIH